MKECAFTRWSDRQLVGDGVTHRIIDWPFAVARRQRLTVIKIALFPFAWSWVIVMFLPLLTPVCAVAFVGMMWDMVNE